MLLSGKVAWVTGAGSGIGRGVVHMLAREGAKIALIGRRKEILEGTYNEVCDLGGSGEAVSLDVSDRSAVKSVTDKLLADWGRVDLLINNAGTNIPKRSLAKLDPDDWDRVVNINLTGAFNMVHAVLPTMRIQKDGIIINIASIAGIGIYALSGAAYTASKHGMMGLHHHINEEEWEHNIRACAICPGEVETPLLSARPVTPSKEELARMTQPEDIADAVRMVLAMPARTTIGEMTIFPTQHRKIAHDEVN